MDMDHGMQRQTAGRLGLKQIKLSNCVKLSVSQTDFLNLNEF